MMSSLVSLIQVRKVLEGLQPLVELSSCEFFALSLFKVEFSS